MNTLRVGTIRLSLACLVAILLAGCASTTIYPGTKGNYSLVTTSSDQGIAEKDAEEKAEKYCNKMGKSLAVISHQTDYHGMDKNNAAIVGLAGAILAGNGNLGRSNEDYQVTMQFKCQ